MSLQNFAWILRFAQNDRIVYRGLKQTEPLVLNSLWNFVG